MSDYVDNGNWLSMKNYDKTAGFDIFEDITEWPDNLTISGDKIGLKVMNGKITKYRTLLVKNNISTDMILKNSRKILWKHGQCLSFEPPKSVRLCLLTFIF